MSFYLLPPVSYQTQQKVKNHVNRKKEHKNRRKHNESTSSSIRSTSKSVKSNSIYNKTVSNKSIDELSNLDSLSIHSEQSQISEVAKKEKKHTFNYSYNTDLNEAIKYSSKHRISSDRKRYNGSIYSPSQYTASQYQNSAYSSSLYSDEDSLLVRHNPTTTQTVESQHDTHIINIKEEAEDLNNEDYKNSFDFQLSEDDDDEQEANKLTRVYSDVDSIFSTKVDVSPKKLKFFSK